MNKNITIFYAQITKSEQHQPFAFLWLSIYIKNPAANAAAAAARATTISGRPK